MGEAREQSAHRAKTTAEAGYRDPGRLKRISELAPPIASPRGFASPPALAARTPGHAFAALAGGNRSTGECLEQKGRRTSMISSIFIIIVSAVMFAYWFRCTSILILNAKTPSDHSSEVAKGMQFARVRTALIESKNLNAATIHRSLNRDYQLVTQLMRVASTNSVEGAILEIDYWLMSVRSVFMQRLAPAKARSALLEMSSIIGYLASLVGNAATQNVN